MKSAFYSRSEKGVASCGESAHAKKFLKLNFPTLRPHKRVQPIPPVQMSLLDKNVAFRQLLTLANVMEWRLITLKPGNLLDRSGMYVMGLRVLTRPAGRVVSTAVLLCMVATMGCRHFPKRRDPHVHKGGPPLVDNTNLVSPPTLGRPIYACSKGVEVKDFIPGARIDIFIQGNPTPIGGGVSQTSWGQPFDTSVTFDVGQVVYAVQTYEGAKSPPSNLVPVTSYTDDYPSGLPTPRITSIPLLECGRAIAFAGALPGAWVSVFSENPQAGGGFAAPVQIGGTDNAQPDSSYVFVDPAFVRGARISLLSGICTVTSAPSDTVIVQAAPPGKPPTPKMDKVYEGTQIVTVWGPGGNPHPLLNGATIDVFDNPMPGGNHVGGQPTPGGGQQVGIDPAAPASGNHYNATQKLCETSDPSSTVSVTPCRDVPAPIIRQPMPGDTEIDVTQYVPGARITVYVNNNEVGDGGPPAINMIDGSGNPRPLADGEVVTVVQRMGDCKSQWRYVITVGSTINGTTVPTSGDWPMFRNGTLRDGQQHRLTALGDPYTVRKLKVKWQFPPPGQHSVGGVTLRGFRASPMVHGGKVYLGNGNGFLYALDENSGALLWQYPPSGGQALTSQFVSNPSSYGIASSAAFASLDRGDLVIIGAPDQRVGKGLGSGRLIALRADTGAEFWLSPEIAVLDGLTPDSLTERHEQIGYSSPLVLSNRVYIGMADHGDNPIQNGRVAAVSLFDGSVEAGFNYHSTSTRGGGIWSSVAGASGQSVYITTGNAEDGNLGGAPAVNHSLSMLRLDGFTGNINWEIQPVPFSMDNDPDWASGVTLSASAGGDIALGTMKDGWAYAVKAHGGGLVWQFPPTGFPFHPGDGTDLLHGDTRYLIPGAAWNDVFFVTAAGASVTTDQTRGYNRVHALNVFASEQDRVRWVLEVPGTSPGMRYQLGPPTVTQGIVFVGTAQSHLIAVADPSVYPAADCGCSNPDVSVKDCLANGYKLVPKPIILLDLNLSDPGSILTEPVLADGRVFVATDGGTIYMLEPAP
jgi:outer membrane protein assembly factor BamB